jgi:RHS repeat-associated protein
MGSLVDGMRDPTGQIYMRNRYYDPATGQFTQPDPIGIAGGLNSYGFAAGDPVTYSDPYGLKPDSVYIIGNPEYIARVSASLMFMAKNSRTFNRTYNAVAGSSMKHVWITEEGAARCGNAQGSCTRPQGVNGARISHRLTSPDYFENYTFGAFGKGDQSILGHEFAHAAALLLPETVTGVSRDCASRTREVREPCARDFEDRVDGELGAKRPTNPQQAVPPP